MAFSNPSLMRSASGSTESEMVGKTEDQRQMENIMKRNALASAQGTENKGVSPQELLAIHNQMGADVGISQQIAIAQGQAVSEPQPRPRQVQPSIVQKAPATGGKSKIDDIVSRAMSSYKSKKKANAPVQKKGMGLGLLMSMVQKYAKEKGISDIDKAYEAFAKENPDMVKGMTSHFTPEQKSKCEDKPKLSKLRRKESMRYPMDKDPRADEDKRTKDSTRDESKKDRPMNTKSIGKIAVNLKMKLHKLTRLAEKTDNPAILRKISLMKARVRKAYAGAKDLTEEIKNVTYKVDPDVRGKENSRTKDVMDTNKKLPWTMASRRQAQFGLVPPTPGGDKIPMGKPVPSMPPKKDIMPGIEPNKPEDATIPKDKPMKEIKPQMGDTENAIKELQKNDDEMMEAIEKLEGQLEELKGGDSKDEKKDKPVKKDKKGEDREGKEDKTPAFMKEKKEEKPEENKEEKGEGMEYGAGKIKGPGVPDGTGPHGGTSKCQLSKDKKGKDKDKEKKAGWAAEFSQKASKLDSYWTIKDGEGKETVVASGRDVFGKHMFSSVQEPELKNKYASYWDLFKSQEYADNVISRIQSDGIRAVASLMGVKPILSKEALKTEVAKDEKGKGSKKTYKSDKEYYTKAWGDGGYASKATKKYTKPKDSAGSATAKTAQKDNDIKVINTDIENENRKLKTQIEAMNKKLVEKEGALKEANKENTELANEEILRQRAEFVLGEVSQLIDKGIIGKADKEKTIDRFMMIEDESALKNSFAILHTAKASVVQPSGEGSTKKFAMRGGTKKPLVNYSKPAHKEDKLAGLWSVPKGAKK